MLNFNGQWNIYDCVERDGRVVSPVLKRMLDQGHDGVKYFNIAKTQYDYSRIFYMVSSHSPWDAKQLKLVEGFRNIHVIRFRNSHHGIPFLKCSLSNIINMPFEQLCLLEGKEHLPILFDFHIAGFLPTCAYLYKLVMKRFFRR